MALLVISCSLNPASRSRMLAQAAQASLTCQGAEAVLLDLREYNLPLCDGEAAYSAPGVNEIRRLVEDASGVLIATPIYNYGVSASAKNLLELTGGAWREKLAGFLCAAGGRWSYMAVMSLANSLMLDYHCVILPPIVYAHERQFDDHRVIDTEVEARIDALTSMFIRFTNVLQPAPKQAP